VAAFLPIMPMTSADRLPGSRGSRRWIWRASCAWVGATNERSQPPEMAEQMIMKCKTPQDAPVPQCHDAAGVQADRAFLPIVMCLYFPGARAMEKHSHLDPLQFWR
jgi:hypothetical protein